MAIDLRTLGQMEIIQRALFCQMLKEIGVEKLQQVEKKHQLFIIEIEGGDFEDSTYEIDFEFALFEATPYQIEGLLSCFMKKEEPKEEVSNIIVEDKPAIEKDRPPLFIV